MTQERYSPCFTVHLQPFLISGFANLTVRLARQIDHILAKIEGIFITLILSAMILLSFAQVVLRNLFNGGILWGDILLRQTVLWVGFLGAALAARENRHISIDFLSHFTPEPWKRPLGILIHTVTGLITAVLAWASWTFIRFEREGGSTLFLDYPVWVFQVILPYSFMIIAIRFLLKACCGLFPPSQAE